MKHIINFTLILLSYIIVSCIILDEVISEIPKNIYNGETKAIINDLPKSNLSLYFINNAKNIILNIDSCEIYNVKTFSYESNGFILTNKSNLTIFNDYHSLLFDDTLKIDNIILPLQNIKHWNPMTYPLFNNNGSYVKLYGKILNEISENNYFEICSSEIFIPVSGHLKEKEKNIIYLILENDCPWYYELNGKMTNVLTSINFNVSIQNWANVTYGDITL